MSRDYRIYLEDILEACEKISHYVKDITYEEFMQDQMRFDAVVRNLEIIGEAARHLPHNPFPFTLDQ